MKTLLLACLASIILPVGGVCGLSPAPPFPGAGGNYGGVLMVPDADIARVNRVTRGHLPNETPLNSGAFTAQIGESGSFSGTLNWQGFKYNVKGVIDASTASFDRDFADLGNSGQKLALHLVLHPSTRTLTCDLSGIDVDNNSFTATGELSGAEPDPAAGAAFGGTLNTSFINPPDYGSVEQPIPGDGFSITRVSKNRGFLARIIGRLPDTEPFTAGSRLRGTEYTIFSGLYFNKGRFGGLTIGTLSASDLTSIRNILLWAKRKGVSDYYPTGFETGFGIETLVYLLTHPGQVNSQPIPKISTEPGPVSATLELEYGNLGKDVNGEDIAITAQIQIGRSGTKVFAPNPARISLRTNAAKATWDGSFIHPVSGKRTSFHGTFVQAKGDKNGEGRGNFKGSIANNASGFVESGSARILVN